MAQYDLILQGGRYFDGSCAPSAIRSLAIKDGRIALVSAEPLDPALAGQVIDVQGKWITPGFLDTHTHYDAELIVAPSLSESVRHGVTTVLVGSCSLSMVCSAAEDASDIFTRVETVSREKVLPILRQHKSWSSPAQWRAFIDRHPLGPNLISFLGHSDLRVAVMGLHRATDRQVTPSEDELQRMEALLEEALDCGFLGLSTMCLKWDKIDGDREWSKSLPSTYARWREVRRLNRLLRRRGRVHQGAPNAANPLQITQYIGEAIGLLRKPLKTTLISLLDLKGNRSLALLARFSAWLTNRLGGDFRWQLLPTPFAIYADGMDIVLFEEFGDAVILGCPDASLVGRNFAEVARERGLHVVDLFLDMVVQYGRQLRWFTVIGNHRQDKLREMVRSPNTLITFSDAGAHIRNMAFYNLPLRFLKLVQDSHDEGRPVMSLEQAVHRLTGEQADWLGIDAGYIRVGDRADLVVLDPAGLRQNLEQEHWDEMQGFGIPRMVCRNPGCVSHVLINGKLAVDDEQIAPELGRQSGFGQFLAAR